jgi:hypothetical protein
MLNLIEKINPTKVFYDIFPPQTTQYYKLFSENFCSLLECHNENDMVWQHLAYFVCTDADYMIAVFGFGEKIPKVDNFIYINFSKEEVNELNYGVFYNSDEICDYVFIVKKNNVNEWITAIPDANKVFADYFQAGF